MKSKNPHRNNAAGIHRGWMEPDSMIHRL